jgi:sugar-specific transcriptional regulator TrmB
MMSIMADNTKTDSFKTIEIQSLLSTLGFSTEESLLYITLLSLSTPTALELSRKLNIPRTTVYRQLKTLIENGAATKIIDKNGSKYKAVHPMDFGRIQQKIKRENRTKLEAIEQLQRIIPKESLTALPRTQVRYYSGKEGLKQMMWNTLKAKSTVYGQSQYKLRDILGDKFLMDYAIEFINKGLHDKTLINDLSVPRILNKLRSTVHHQKKEDLTDIHVVDQKDLYISGDMWIYNNIVATAFWNENETTGIEIENPEIAKMQQSLYLSTWNKADTLPKYLKDNKIIL